MTEENYEYRTSQLMLRNEFPGAGHWKIPVIPKFQIQEGDFDDLLLIGFDRAKPDDDKHHNRMVHFFLYDYKFERVWKQPEADLEKLSNYRAVLSPDFSMYLEMNPTMQLYNTFRNRWCGAYWASKGVRVIPTVNWGDESTFDFCFLGIEKGSTVAISTYMATEHNNHSDQKEWFMAGYREMLRRIQPEKIICYNSPFPEMEGDIVYVDYDRSSWRYMNYECSLPNEDLDCYKIGGEIWQGHDIMEPYRIGKGSGSAYGGEWQPSKPEDQRFLGEPGSVNISTNTKGAVYETQIGNDGRAVSETHNTDHGFPAHHSNPHTHDVSWEGGYPHLVSDIGVGKFLRGVRGGHKMHIQANSLEDNRFKSISDFKWCMRQGGEVQFVWNGITYCCFGKIVQLGGSSTRMVIAQAGTVEVNAKTEKWCDTADELLEYMVGEDRLRDVITKVTVIERTI